MNTVSFRRERWVYGLHALVGFLLALPILGLIGDWLLSALEAFLFMVVAMLGFELIPLLPVLAVGWATLVGYWLLVMDGQCSAAAISSRVVCERGLDSDPVLEAVQKLNYLSRC